LNLKQKKL